MSEKDSKCDSISKIKVSDLIDSGTRKVSDNDMSRMVQSAKKYGIMLPVIVRKIKDSEKKDLVSGHIKKKAAEQAGISELLAIEKEMTDLKALEWSLSENIDRIELNLIDLAEGFKKLNDMGETQQQIVDNLHLNKHQSYVSETISLLELSEPIQEHIRNGRINRSIAVSLVTIKDPQMQIKLADLSAKNEWSVKQFRRARKLMNKPTLNQNDTSKQSSACMTLSKCNVPNLLAQILKERKSKQVTNECNQCPDQNLCARIAVLEDHNDAKNTEPDNSQQPSELVFEDAFDSLTHKRETEDTKPTDTTLPNEENNLTSDKHPSSEPIKATKPTNISSSESAQTNPNPTNASNNNDKANTLQRDANPPATSNVCALKVVDETTLQPQSYQEIFGNKKTLDFLKALAAFPRNMQNIALLGEHGCGKTTLARLCAASVLGKDWELWTYQAGHGAGKGIGIAASSLITKGERDALGSFLRGGTLKAPPGIHFKICVVKNLDDIPKTFVREFTDWIGKYRDSIRFILTCEDSKKMPPEILKKCLPLYVEPLSDLEMAQLLKHLAGKCDFEFSDVQLNEIRKEAKGIPQTAVNLLIATYTILKAQQMNNQDSQLNCNTDSDDKSDASKRGL